ncbi:Glycoside hydrolase family 38 protein [Mycena sanguinolenta]|uniref:alpha-mannosidase n=1 Tax=Mycena sanguinolenta TaxID=230812 RepID=A0A8H7CIA8_9AGAR|nr:Glycoside hydrolase family 38 protein [Mycena sanguinolenta]
MNVNGHNSQAAHTQAYQRLARYSQAQSPPTQQRQPQMHTHQMPGHAHGHAHGASPQAQAAAYPTLNPSSGAKWIKSLTQSRLGQFNGGHFGDVNLGSVLYERKEDGEKYVKLEVWSAPGLTKPSFAEAMKQQFKPAHKGDSFGPSWTNHWWKVSLKIPQDEFAQYERVTFEFDPGCEAMIFDLDGTPVHGITGGYAGDRRVEYIIPPSARKAGEHKFVIESSCNGMFGMGGGGIGPPDPNRYFTLDMADIVVPNQDAWRLLWDFTTLRELVDTLPGNTPLQNAALTAANGIMNTFDHNDRSSIKRAREVAWGVLRHSSWRADVAIPCAFDHEGRNRAERSLVVKGIVEDKESALLVPWVVQRKRYRRAEGASGKQTAVWCLFLRDYQRRDRMQKRDAAEDKVAGNAAEALARKARDDLVAVYMQGSEASRKGRGSVWMFAMARSPWQEKVTDVRLVRRRMTFLGMGWDAKPAEKKRGEETGAARRSQDPVVERTVVGGASKEGGKDWDAVDDGADVYDGADAEGDEKGRSLVWGIGHCHIDTAWLWPYSVTQQKTARSWATQIDLMERYPEHRFACSQAQQWKWLEQQYPTLFKRISAQVDAKKFHPIGGAWVEHDANMPSGEALVRQMLYGQRYFQSRFGVRCETGWLPDSFGLTGALPQLFRGAGMKYFFTQKLSWNNINNFPHTTFNWVGIDGTQVLCHMTPVDTYTAQASVGDVNRAITNHKNLESSDTSLLVFGNGDGGGGPLPKMLENLRRMRAVTNNHRELPPVHMGRSVDQFFDYLAESSQGGKVLPNWKGELYLEFHRGTYTSHGSIKKGNRHSEILLRDVEILATMASLSEKKYVYPKQRIDEAWEKVLLNQFHDVLPGSAIGMVYDDAEKLYAEVREACEEMIDNALDVVLGGHTQRLGAAAAAAVTDLNQLVAYNTTPFPRCEVVQVPLPAGNSALRTQVAQLAADGKTGYAFVNCEGGRKPAVLAAPPVTEAWGFSPVSVYTNGADHFVLRNASMQLTISRGRITSLLDVQLGRELIQKGATGGLVIFEDRPNYWDAWDVEIHHLEKATQLEFTKVSVVAQGPLRASVETEVVYGQSRINVTISLDAVPPQTPGSRSMFRFDACVDWHQRHEFLKFELPLAINSDNATYETQFGWVQRPTHKNTTWDMAKALRSLRAQDLSEYGYGVALLSESKGNILRISLLRAATEPDAEQDQGEHTFSWAVMPHKGHFLESNVPITAYLFNSPLHIRALTPGGSATSLNSSPLSFALAGAPNVIFDTMKRGEDDSFKAGGKNTIVCRAYEAFGGHARAQLRINDELDVEAAYETNLLEDLEDGTVQALRPNGPVNEIDLSFRGFEVKTLVLVLGEKKRKAEKRESWVTVDT